MHAHLKTIPRSRKLSVGLGVNAVVENGEAHGVEGDL